MRLSSGTENYGWKTLALRISPGQARQTIALRAPVPAPVCTGFVEIDVGAQAKKRKFPSEVCRRVRGVMAVMQAA